MNDHVGNSTWISFLSLEHTVQGPWPYFVLGFIAGFFLFSFLTFIFRRRIFSQPQLQVGSGKGSSLEKFTDKYSTLLKLAPFGVFEIESRENGRQTFTVSERFFEILGLQKRDVALSWELLRSLVHPEDQAEFGKLFQAGEKIIHAEARVRVGRDYRWFRGQSASQPEGRKNVWGRIGILEDIHESRAAEEKLRNVSATLEEDIRKRTLQLEQANRAKTRFIANMSHEIRTPLGLILGFSELLKDNQNLDGEGREYVQLIRKNGEILSCVINDLLDLSKIEAGKLSFHYSQIHLKNLIEDFRKAFADQAAEKGLGLVFKNFCTEDETVVTDEIRLKQIVYNLLSNAIKFTDRGSIQVVVESRDSRFFVDVIDSGLGIPDAEKTRIFDEFSRGQLAEAGHRAGSGLGLKLSQNLAQALGGQVELISSQVGKGSHFRLTFQSENSKLQAQVLRRSESSLNNKLNNFEIFVLDDNEDNIRLTEIFLKKMGAKVRGFTTPQSLFAEMASATPTLILLDINMPEMSGFEVFDRLRQLGYKNPIWALTAYSLNEDIRAILEHGFDDFIRKPISVDSMKRKLSFELREQSHD